MEDAEQTEDAGAAGLSGGGWEGLSLLDFVKAIQEAGKPKKESQTGRKLFDGSADSPDAYVTKVWTSWTPADVKRDWAKAREFLSRFEGCKGERAVLLKTAESLYKYRLQLINSLNSVNLRDDNLTVAGYQSRIKDLLTNADIPIQGMHLFLFDLTDFFI